MIGAPETLPALSSQTSSPFLKHTCARALFDGSSSRKVRVATPSTTFVSKENAQIELAKVLAKTNPAEAQKILEPLRQMSTRNQVSRWAITAYGETRPGPKP